MGGGPLNDAEMRRMSWENLDAWNAHDADAVLAHVTDDVAWTQPGRSVRGKAAAREEVVAYFSAFPDLRFDRDAFEVYVDAERASVVVVWSATGTMTGSVHGVPATGRVGEVRGMTLSRFRGDLVSENWILYDNLDYMQQLGFLPSTESPAFKALVMGDVMARKARQAVEHRLAGRR